MFQKTLFFKTQAVFFFQVLLGTLRLSIIWAIYLHKEFGYEQLLTTPKHKRNRYSSSTLMCFYQIPLGKFLYRLKLLKFLLNSNHLIVQEHVETNSPRCLPEGSSLFKGSLIIRHYEVLPINLMLNILHLLILFENLKKYLLYMSLWLGY